MRSVVFTDEAEAQLDEQIDYLIGKGETAIALRLLDRVRDFVSKVLAEFPSAGRPLEGHAARQAFIPGTPFVLWYQHTDDELIVLAVFHERQDR